MVQAQRYGERIVASVLDTIAVYGYLCQTISSPDGSVQRVCCFRMVELESTTVTSCDATM